MSRGRGYLHHGSATLAAAVLVAAVAALFPAGPLPGAQASPPPSHLAQTASFRASPETVGEAAPGFRLIDQRGEPANLSAFEGHTVVLTFINPVCISDCPLIAQYFRQADQSLGVQAADVDFVAIVADPKNRALSLTGAFDRQEYLAHVANWYYLTGSARELSDVRHAYAALIAGPASNTLVAQGEVAYVIDGHGREAAVLTDSPAVERVDAPFSSVLLDHIERTLPA